MLDAAYLPAFRYFSVYRCFRFFFFPFVQLDGHGVLTVSPDFNNVRVLDLSVGHLWLQLHISSSLCFLATSYLFIALFSLTGLAALQDTRARWYTI